MDGEPRETAGPNGPDGPDGQDGQNGLFSELRDFLADEDELIASLGAALDELAATASASRLGGDDRAALWRRIEARVERAG